MRSIAAVVVGVGLLALTAAVAPGTHLPRSHFPRFPIPNMTRHRNMTRLHNTSQVHTRTHTHHGHHRTHMSRAGFQTRMERHDQTLTDERHIRTTPTNPSSSGGFGALKSRPCSAARNGRSSTTAVDNARAAPHPKLQERDGARPPTGSPEPPRREQCAFRQAQVDAGPAVNSGLPTDVPLLALHYCYDVR